MGDSIAAAVRATRDANGWLVLPGDLPFAQPDTLRRVAAALLTHPEADVVVPAFRDQRGHPVGFSARMGAALAQIAGPQGAADVVRQATEKGRRVILAVDDPGIVFDIDTRDDLDRARAWLASHPHL
jgi:molybdenum cofactor cytidylyltransferase